MKDMPKYRLSVGAEYLFNYAFEDFGFWMKDTFTSTPYRSFASLLGIVIAAGVVAAILAPPKRRER